MEAWHSLTSVGEQAGQDHSFQVGLVNSKHRIGGVWFDTVRPSERDVDGIRYILRPAERAGENLTVVIEYQAGGRIWTHTFTPHRIGPDELAADLASAGLALDQWLTDDHAWCTARAAERA